MRNLLLLIFSNWAIWAIGLSGCGGQVHFVSEKKVIPPPPPPPPPSRTITDQFHYGQPIGTQVVVFAFYPNKSLRDARAGLVQAMPAFVNSFWSAASGYPDTRFAVVRDVAIAAPSWFSGVGSGLPRSAWPEASLQFLRRSLTNAAIERAPFEGDTLTPYEIFTQVTRGIAYDIPLNQAPVWLNIFYLRDSDLELSATDQPNLAAEQKQFAQSLVGPPFSKFRTAIHLVSYLTPGGECDPLPDRIATALQGDFDGFTHDANELCDLMSADPAKAGADLNSWGNAIHAQSARLILQKKPLDGTLQVSIAGQVQPREDVILDATSNELSFREGVSPAPQAGDVIQASYEAADD